MKNRTKLIASAIVASALILGASGCGGGSDSGSSSNGGNTTSITASQKTAVLTTYADIALSNYTQAHTDAIALQVAVLAFTTSPSTATQDTAKAAWKTSRESYGTTEAFRLSNGPIDGEEAFSGSFGAPEGQLNAWPLNEAMIDYTQVQSSVAVTGGNIIDGTGNFTGFTSTDGITAVTLGGVGTVDITTINIALLEKFTEVDGDANVATGYHAVEFLLWGQDQDYNDPVADTITNGADVAGQRPFTDYTTDTNSARRIAYINAAADLIVADLVKVKDAWTAGVGSYRNALLNTDTNDTNKIDADVAIKHILAGIGVFVKSELANERIAVAVQDPSEEDEHSCFSDNTHRDIALNFQGFVNVLKGEYLGASQGTSFYSLASAANKTKIDTLVTALEIKIAAIDTAATSGTHFDTQIKNGNANKQNIIDTYREMRDLGDEMVSVASDFGISLTTADVTDSGESDQGQN
ncbi:Iron-regulated protein A precursor [hydrothermal vent metagenome]|uniref:Iron-regulated protein A n=1 Tax=hydrothermal vent metagenome TaxID=652676 RepID=A0A1W1BKW1_9ZZZZ